MAGIILPKNFFIYAQQLAILKIYFRLYFKKGGEINEKNRAFNIFVRIVGMS